MKRSFFSFSFVGCWLVCFKRATIDKYFVMTIKVVYSTIIEGLIWFFCCFYTPCLCCGGLKRFCSCWLFYFFVSTQHEFISDSSIVSSLKSPSERTHTRFTIIITVILLKHLYQFMITVYPCHIIVCHVKWSYPIRPPPTARECDRASIYRQLKLN